MRVSTARMREQTVAAIKQADLVVFLIDARAGIVAGDEIFAELVRSSGKPVILAANKVEGRAAEAGMYEAFSLGLGEPLPISAEHDLGIGELSDLIQQAARGDGGAEIAEETGEEDEAAVHPLRIAVVGRPNVGKSTLVNAILGEERMITGPEAGITRDAIAIDLERQGRLLRLFDTAGLRRKMRMEGTAEELSVGDTLKAIKFAEIVVLLLDAERPFEKQDLQIADLIVQEGRALVIAVNKWDLVRASQARLAELRETCERLLPQIKGVAFVPVSALTGKGIDKLVGAVLAADALWNKRLPTHALNQWLREAVDAHSPPAVSGPAHQAQIHHPEQCAAADLRAVLLAAEGIARLLCALSRQFVARDLRPSRRADQAASAQGREPLCQGERPAMSDGVTEVYFYHLERRTLEEVLPTLLERSLERGWRAAVQAASEERVEALDTLLWTYREESFLAHGTARDGHVEAHPIYLTSGGDNPNGAQVRFLVDGAELDDASPYTRVVYVFDGRDEAAVAQARAEWQKAKTHGFSVSYWQQDGEGRWQQKA